MKILTEHTTGVSDAMMRGHMAAVKDYVGILHDAQHDLGYHAPESALAAANDTATRTHVLDVTTPLRAQLKKVILVGIGGSDLGTRAIYDALYGHQHAYTGQHTPELLCFGTVEPRVLSAMRQVFATHTDPKEVVLIVISKSGSTAETVTNANILFTLMREQYGEASARAQTIVISDPDTPLAETTRGQGMTHVAMPHAIGGRYSVFTAVGLVPLSLLGVDIEALCAGARAGASASAPHDRPSPAALLASLLYDAYLTDLCIHEMFLWHPELETLGKWYRQLLAESIGKQRLGGIKVGIMPTIALGSTDLHSLGQLVFGGPRDRFTTFVSAPEKWENTDSISDDSPFTLPVLAHKRTGDVMRAIYGGVCASYKAHDLPFVRIELDAITPREIGAFMAVQMASVMYLARLFDVNAFDQPNVEDYKAETRKLLAE